MAARMRGRRARLGALAAACAAMLALAVALGVTQRGDAPGATAQTATTTPTTATATTTTTALPANPPTCTARTLGVSRASNPGLAADCDTLLAIKSTLRVTGWLDYDRADWRDHGAWLNWSAAAPMRFWQVITLGGTPQRVTGLDFSDTRESVKVYHARLRRFVDSEHYTRHWTLRGVIPTQLGNLTALETLDLGGSELTGTIPTQLGSLTKLTRLDLSDNRLRGNIPTQLGSLTALTALDLSGNRLGGNLPAGLRNLPPTLATLRLSGNSFTGCIDERLRLAETNDLTTLMKARSLSWCPVAALPAGSALTAAETYQVHGGTIIDIPSTGPRVQYVIGVTSDGGGEAFCLADMSRQESVCIDGYTGEEWSRGRIPLSLRELQAAARSGASGAADTPTPVSGLEEVFDQIVASARSAP